jgi:hypothetical protein
MMTASHMARHYEVSASTLGRSLLPRGCSWRAAVTARFGIGVVGLRGGRLSHVRLPNGAVNHTAFTHVLEALPDATFEDATDVVGMIRAEEIACLRHAARIAEAGVEKLVELARPGADASVVYAAVTERMLALGSEYYPLAITSDPIGEPQSARYTNPPLGRRFQANDLITNQLPYLRARSGVCQAASDGLQLRHDRSRVAGQITAVHAPGGLGEAERLPHVTVRYAFGPPREAVSTNARISA